MLEPAVARARERGINAHGPIPADALIPAAVRGKWNIVVACYHDQGHAPFKAVYGDDGVNITIGLPVVRVSVDHGTAFDIAGKRHRPRSQPRAVLPRAPPSSPLAGTASGKQPVKAKPPPPDRHFRAVGPTEPTARTRAASGALEGLIQLIQSALRQVRAVIQASPFRGPWPHLGRSTMAAHIR